MQKIGAILTRNFQNPTLRRAFFEHQAAQAWDTLLHAHELAHWQGELTHLIRRRQGTITLHLSSSNALLLTHLRLQSHTLETEYLHLLQTIDKNIDTVVLKLRST